MAGNTLILDSLVYVATRHRRRRKLFLECATT